MRLGYHRRYHSGRSFSLCLGVLSCHGLQCARCSVRLRRGTGRDSSASGGSVDGREGSISNITVWQHRGADRPHPRFATPLAASAARVSAPSRSVGVTAFNPPSGCECSARGRRPIRRRSAPLTLMPPAPSARHGASRRRGGRVVAHHSHPASTASSAAVQHRRRYAAYRARPRHVVGLDSGIRSCGDWLVLPPCPLASTYAAALSTVCPCHSRSPRIADQPDRGLTRNTPSIG